MDKQPLLLQVQDALTKLKEGRLGTKTAQAVLEAVHDYLVAEVDAAAEAAMHQEDVQEATLLRIIKTLSFTERKAARAMAAHLTGTETLMVTSKVADGAGVTRSTLVTTLRKLESAGVVKTHSLGQKGTMIRVLIPAAADFLLAAA